MTFKTSEKVFSRMLVENTDPSPDIIRHALRASCLFVQQNDRYTTDDDL